MDDNATTPNPVSTPSPASDDAAVKAPAPQASAVEEKSATGTTQAAAPAPAADATPKEKLPIGDKPRLLLAEDEDDARTIYTDILGGGEFELDTSPNGRKTLEFLEQKIYDLLLLDIIMPDMDGISVLTEIKKYPAKYGTPKVVMLTNIGGDLAIEKALNIGANGYMLKSETDPEELVRIIKKYLAGENNVKPEKKITDM